MLELQNIELEINLQIQEKMISDMKTIIGTQKSIIQENNIVIDAEEDIVLDDEDL